MSETNGHLITPMRCVHCGRIITPPASGMYCGPCHRELSMRRELVVEQAFREQEEAERLRKIEAEERRLYTRTESSADLARFADDYGFSFDSRSDVERKKAAFKSINWEVADRGNLVRIAIASEETAKGTATLRREIAGLRKEVSLLRKSLADVVDLFKVVLTPVAKQVRERGNDE